MCVVTNNANNFVKALKESTANEVSEEEDDAITIKRAVEMLDEQAYHVPAHYHYVSHTI